MKAATFAGWKALGYSVKFQSTPPVKAATDIQIFAVYRIRISIHAAREGGDHPAVPIWTSVYISIHAAREGGDKSGIVQFASIFGFQSTPPVKAATDLESALEEFTEFQSTPPVKAATSSALAMLVSMPFQSTPPVKAATTVYGSEAKAL